MVRLVVGCGYLGCRVADAWVSQGDAVFVLTRSAPRARQLAENGLQPLIGDVTQPESLRMMPQVDTVLWAVGHDRQSGRSIHEVYVEGLGNLVHTLAEQTQRIIYISSTGVYGQSDGSWVDETSPCAPSRGGGQACLSAEQLLLGSRWADRTVILRLAGIYGPQRLPRMRQVVAGQPLRTASDGMLNLIHVEDAAQAVIRAAQADLQPPRVFLISDGKPVVRRTFYEELAVLLGAPHPCSRPRRESPLSRVVLEATNESPIVG